MEPIIFDLGDNFPNKLVDKQPTLIEKPSSKIITSTKPIKVVENVYYFSPCNNLIYSSKFVT